MIYQQASVTRVQSWVCQEVEMRATSIDGSPAEVGMYGYKGRE